MPEGLLDPSEELIINNISFPQEGVIELSYSEKRDHSDFAGIVKTIFVDIDKCKVSDQVEDLTMSARDVIDMALTAIRQPPPKFTRPGRTISREPDAPLDD